MIRNDSDSVFTDFIIVKNFVDNCFNSFQFCN